MRILVLVIAVVSLVPCPAFCQEETPDFQLRIPNHVQILKGENAKAENRFGLAVWGILPDVTAEGGQLTTLVVGGFLWQNNRKNWVEVMFGSRLNQNGYVDPIFNLRLLDNHIPKVAVSGEIQQSFRQERKRFYWWIAADTPAPLWKLRVGGETENVHLFGKSASLGIGPRVSAPIPLKLPASGKMSVVTTYQIRNDRDFLRTYIVTNFSFDGGKK